MTSLDRAKHFLASKARTLALTAVPLAALVAVAPPPAKGGMVIPSLTFNSGSCSTTTTGNGANVPTPSCSNATTSNTNGANGLHLTGNLTSQGNQSGGTFSSVLDWLGTTNGGTFNGMMPLSFKFSVGFSPAPIVGSVNVGPAVPSDYSWILDFWFNDQTVNVHVFGSGSGPNTTFSPPGQIALALNGTVSNWEAKLVVTRAGGASGDKLTVTVPNSSVDFNAAASVPEPATMGLLGSALGFLLWRKRRQQT